MDSFCCITSTQRIQCSGCGDVSTCIRYATIYYCSVGIQVSEVIREHHWIELLISLPHTECITTHMESFLAHITREYDLRP